MPSTMMRHPAELNFRTPHCRYLNNVLHMHSVPPERQAESSPRLSWCCWMMLQGGQSSPLTAKRQYALLYSSRKVSIEILGLQLCSPGIES